MNLKKAVIFSVMLAGATAMASQIVFLRECLVSFYGNEISVGIILAAWLVWGAFGSWILGRLSDNLRSKIHVFAVCQIILAIILPITLIAIRSSKDFLGVASGEIVSYAQMFTAVLIILSASCCILGFMFSLACRVYRDITAGAAKSVANIYVTEALGALVGGSVVSFFLISRVPALWILFAISFLNIAASITLQRTSPDFLRRKIFYWATVSILILSSAAACAGGVRGLRQFSLALLWKGFDVLESRDSVYGNITVTERAGQTSFFENGLHLYTVPDHLSREEAVHFALLENEDPSKILLIGGGVGGLLEEILKHPVSEVDYVELDPMIITEAENFLGNETKKALNDPKVTIINEDGRFFVKQAQKKYDCIIISLGDPYTIQLNRFYTKDFFDELSHIMDDGGILSFALTSSENYIGGELKDYLNSVYLSLSASFSDVLLIPGDTMYFLASNRRGVLTSDMDTLIARLNERGINTQYVREYYLFDKLSKERIEYATKAVSENSDGLINRDFRPIAYYYATRFWGTHFEAPFFRRFTENLKTHAVWAAVSIVCILIFIFGIFDRKRRGKRTVLLSLMTTGFAEISFQIAVILSFQVIYGYMFYKMGIILTCFMAGLAAGGWIASKNLDRIKDHRKAFSWTQCAICVYPLILPPVFFWLARSESNVVSFMGANIIFPVLPIVAGIIGGIQFPLANKIYLTNEEETGRVAGISYGLDLLGACFGSFFAAAFLMPILGIFETCILVAVINVAVLVSLLISRSSLVDNKS